jgi:hypothetical protein
MQGYSFPDDHCSDRQSDLCCQERQPPASIMEILNVKGTQVSGLKG